MWWRISRFTLHQLENSTTGLLNILVPFPKVVLGAAFLCESA